MKLGLIFTNDWELYGDGSGDFWEVQYNPIKNALDVLDSFDAKMTIMAEVGQQFGFKSIANKFEFAARIESAWEELIKNTITRGHDVQLHYHPQWVNAQYINDKWILDNGEWSIGKSTEEKIQTMIAGGKEYLESLIRPIKDSYKCTCFRAGAYYIEPSTNVLKVLRSQNFMCDTSVTKRLVSDQYFNYTNAVSNVLPYFIRDDVKTSTDLDREFIEMPIYSRISFESKILRKFFPKQYFLMRYGKPIPDDEISWGIKRDKLKNIRYPKENRFYKSNQKKDFKFYIQHFFSRAAQQLDYDYIYPTEFIYILKNIFRDKDILRLKTHDIIIPVVASGHIKDIPDTGNIEKILKLIRQEMSDQVIFWTLSDAVKYVFDNKSKFINSGG